MDLPVRYSIVDSAALAEQVFPAYGLGVARACSYWRGGQNDVYRIETDDAAYILRLSRFNWRSRGAIEDELELIRALADAGIGAARPRRSVEGRELLELRAPEGPRLAVVFDRAPGVRLGELPPEFAEFLGHSVARMHARWDALDEPGRAWRRFYMDLDFLVTRALATLDPWCAEVPGYASMKRECVPALRETIAELPRGAPYFGLCHGDLHTGNFHCDARGRPTLFDFDLCGHAYRAFDLAVFYADLAGGGHPDPGLAWRAFIRGYERLRALDPRELEAIPQLIAARRLSLLAAGLRRLYDLDRHWLHTAYLSRELEQICAWAQSPIAGGVHLDPRTPADEAADSHGRRERSGSG